MCERNERGWEDQRNRKNRIDRRSCDCNGVGGAEGCQCQATVRFNQTVIAVISLHSPNPSADKGRLELTAEICTSCRNTGLITARYISETRGILNFSIDARSNFVRCDGNRVEIEGESSDRRISFSLIKSFNGRYHLYVNDRNIVTWDILFIPITDIRGCT
ncbi:hypothetical protein WAX78_01540 [Bacillus sp. FJAT-53711]|uniref:Uncharacterized protein n=1 Tax=Bacillus yunxiaonensis TaxID=3127665 RepID=A0ABU8FSH8_9BACI